MSDHPLKRIEDVGKRMVADMMAACERPDSVARVRFGDGPWESVPGPEVLRRIETNDCAVTVESVKVPRD